MRYSFSAYHLKDRLKLREVKNILPFNPYRMNSDEIVYKFKDDSYIFLYRFGTTVFFNVSPEDQKTELARITDKFKIADINIDETVDTSDEFYLEVEPASEITVLFDTIKCPNLDYNIIYIMSLVLAQSVSLEYFELIVDDMMNKSTKIMRQLERTGKTKHKAKELIKHIGFVRSTNQ